VTPGGENKVKDYEGDIRRNQTEIRLNSFGGKCYEKHQSVGEGVIIVTLDMDCCAGEEGRSGNVSVGRSSAGNCMRAIYVDSILCFVKGFKVTVVQITLIAVKTQ